MKKGHLIFCLIAAALTAAFSLGGGMFIIGNGIMLTRAEFWRLGFGPVTVGLALVLAAASVAAYRGSELGFQLVALWMFIVSTAYLSLLFCHFSIGWDGSMTRLLVGSILWYLTARHWRAKTAVAKPIDV